MGKTADARREANSLDAGNNGGTSQIPPPKPAGKRAASSSNTTTTRYLILYNFTSFALWATLTGRLLLLLLLLVPSGHVSPIYDALFPLLRITQSVAMLEILHALLGLVRASVLTTGMQVASRIMVVWGVMHMFSKPAMGTSGILGGSGTRPLAERGDWAFIGCLIAWGITECVRYGFFVLQLSGSGVPKWLLWLRYNTFFILYPIGISCECLLVYLAIGPAPLVHPVLPWVFRAILAIYVPGSYILYSHMMTQRRKVMRAAKRAN